MDDLHTLSDLFENWQMLKIAIEELYRQRKKGGLEEATKKAIKLFTDFLYLSNDRPISADAQVSFSDLELTPVNIKERLGFILARPGIFPSYIQLCELMEEQKKLFAKKNIMKKASSQNNG